MACDGIRPAAEYDIGKPDVNSLDNWCSQPSFADNVVNQCTFCYNLTTTQVYLANCVYPNPMHKTRELERKRTDQCPM